MKKLATAGLLAAALIAPSLVSAHPLWVLPSHFTVSKQEGDWVTFDVTASHGTFVFDKPASVEGAYVVMPNGEQKSLKTYCAVSVVQCSISSLLKKVHTKWLTHLNLHT